jgi:hypothetical protein
VVRVATNQMIDAHTYACMHARTYSHAVLTSHPPNLIATSKMSAMNDLPIKVTTYACTHAHTHMHFSPL